MSVLKLDEGLLEKTLSKLSISDLEFDESLTLFNPNHNKNQLNLKKALEILLNCSTKTVTSEILFNVLNKDISSFLEGLSYLDIKDSPLILNHVIDLNMNDEHLKSKFIDKLLNVNKIMIKELSHQDLQDYKNLSTIYFSIINTYNILNPQHISIFLEFLNPFIMQNACGQLPNEIHSLTLLIIVQNINLQKEKSIEQIRDYIDILIDEDIIENFPISKFLNLINIIESFFPLLPQVMAEYYTSDKTKSIVENQINTKISSVHSLQYKSNKLVILEILKLISISSIDDQCRSFNVTNYVELLKIGSKLEFEDIKILSILNIIKLWNFIKLDKDKQSDSKSNDISVDELYLQLKTYLNEYESKSLVNEQEKNFEYVIESLAYLTLNVTVKQNLRKEEGIIEKFVETLKLNSNTTNTATTHSTLIYGILLILSNLGKLNDKSENQDKTTIDYLKNYSKPGSSIKKSEENNEEIQLFNKSLILHHKILSLFSLLKLNKEGDSGSNIMNQAIVIIYQISFNQDKLVRQEMLKQGGLNIVMYYLAKTSKIKNKGNGETRPIDGNNDLLVETRIFALRSLSRMLISVNPELAFGKYDIKTSLPFLIELLGPDLSEYSGDLFNKSDNEDKYLYEQITSLDKFESLLALTNFSSIPKNNEVKKVIILKTFDKFLNNFMIETESPQIQRASWELISNLITEPTLLVKFFNIQDNTSHNENFKRLQLLIKLLNSKDEALQIIISGLLSNATSDFEMICNVLIENEIILNELNEIFIKIFHDQFNNDNLILRVSYIVYNLVYTASVTDDNLLKKFSENKELKHSFSNVIRFNKNEEILEVTKEILKLFK